MVHPFRLIFFKNNNRIPEDSGLRKCLREQIDYYIDVIENNFVYYEILNEI